MSCRPCRPTDLVRPADCWQGSGSGMDGENRAWRLRQLLRRAHHAVGMVEDVASPRSFEEKGKRRNDDLVRESSADRETLSALWSPTLLRRGRNDCRAGPDYIHAPSPLGCWL